MDSSTQFQSTNLDVQEAAHNLDQELVHHRFYNINFMLHNFLSILIGWKFWVANQNAWEKSIV